MFEGLYRDEELGLHEEADVGAWFYEELRRAYKEGGQRGGCRKFQECFMTARRSIAGLAALDLSLRPVFLEEHEEPKEEMLKVDELMPRRFVRELTEEEARWCFETDSAPVDHWPGVGLISSWRKECVDELRSFVTASSDFSEEEKEWFAWQVMSLKGCASSTFVALLPMPSRLESQGEGGRNDA